MIHASLESQRKQRPARVSLINGEIVEVKELQKCVFMMSDNREKTVTSLLILPLRSASQRRRDLFRNYTLIHILEHNSQVNILRQSVETASGGRRSRASSTLSALLGHGRVWVGPNVLTSSNLDQGVQIYNSTIQCTSREPKCFLPK